jgi:nitrogen fixation protein FixH
MNQPLPLSIRSVLRDVAVVVACLVAMAVASPANAGLGGLVKKAKDKAAQAVDKKAESPETAATAGPRGKLVFDDVMVELTEARVSHIIAAVEASAAITAGRPALVEKVEKLMQERHALEDKHGDEMRELRSKRGDVEVCLHDGYGEARDRRSAEYQQKALTDPAIREKFTRAAQQYNAAAARGDTTARQKLNEILMSAILPTREDSAAVEQKCGPVPPPSPAETQASALDKQITSTEEQIRDLDKKAADAQAKKVGLSEGQLAMALERIKMYLAWRKDHDPGKSGSSGGGSGGSDGSGGAGGSGGSEGSGDSGGSDSSSVKIASRVNAGFTAEEIVALEKYLERLRAARLE